MLVDSLTQKGLLKTPRIIDAFKTIRRVNFFPEELKMFSEEDDAFPIKNGQTISKPSYIAFMLELLQPCPGDKIFEVGSGSGWTTAILSQIVGESGRVLGSEIDSDVCRDALENLRPYKFVDRGVANILCADGLVGAKEEGPFDKILVSDAVNFIPEDLLGQVAYGGKIVIPVGHSIFLLEKYNDYHYDQHEYPGFEFGHLVAD